MSLENMKSGWKSYAMLGCGAYLFLLCMCVLITVLMCFFGGHEVVGLNHPMTKAVLCLFFLFCGRVYFLSNAGQLRMLYGGLQILGGLAVDWYQLGKVGDEGWQGNGVFESILFMVAAFAAIANGFKDYYKGEKEYRDDRGQTAELLAKLYPNAEARKASIDEGN